MDIISHKGVLGVIPARYGSTRFPGKPLARIRSKPMIQYVYEQASRSKILDKLIVATDNDEIYDCVKSFGGDVVMTDDSIPTGTDRAAEVARGYPHGIILNIQGDEPLLEGEMLDKLARPLIEDENIDASTLVKKVTEERELTDPNMVRVILDKNGYALYFSRSVIPYYIKSNNKEDWINNHAYYRHIGLYGYRRDFLFTFITLRESSLEKAERLEQLRVLENGYRMKAEVVDYTPYPVDVPEDIKIVEELMLKKAKN